MPLVQLPKHLHPDFSDPKRKPVGAVEVDWSNPLTGGLKNLFVLNNLHEEITGRFVENYNNGATKTALGYSFDGSNDIIKISDSSVDLSDYTGLTVVLRIKGDAQSDKRFMAFGGTTTAFLGIGSDNSSPNEKLRVYSTVRVFDTTHDAKSSAAVLDGDWHNIVLTFESRSLRIFIDGRFDSSNSGTSAPGVNDIIPYVSIGAAIRDASPNGFSYFDGEVAYAAVFNRTLSDVEAASLSENPYQLLRPAIPMQYFYSAGGGGAYTLTAGAGSFTLSGTDANLEFNRYLGASAGSFTLSGTDASLERGWTLTASAGAYSLSGADANLEFGRLLAASAGSYTLTGTDANLNYGTGFTLTAETGTYTLSGAAASLLYDRKIAADSGSYTLSGTAATLARGWTITANAGSYAYSGTDATLLFDAVLSAGAGAFSIVGPDTSLTYSGAKAWTVQPNSSDAWVQQSNSSDTWTEQPNSNDTWTVN